VLFEEPHHSHHHSHVEANHHHEYLAFINQALNGHETAQPIPVELLNYQFETPLPTLVFHLAKNFPLLIKKTIHTLFVPVLTGPSFDVLTPPP